MDRLRLRKGYSLYPIWQPSQSVTECHGLASVVRFLRTAYPRANDKSPQPKALAGPMPESSLIAGKTITPAGQA